MLIDSGSELYIHAAINSQDDVEIKADNGIFIDAAITAGDDLKISARSDIEAAAIIEAADRSYLSAGDNLTLLPESSLRGLTGKRPARYPCAPAA